MSGTDNVNRTCVTEERSYRDVFTDTRSRKVKIKGSCRTTRDTDFNKKFDGAHRASRAP